MLAAAAVVAAAGALGCGDWSAPTVATQRSLAITVSGVVPQGSLSAAGDVDGDGRPDVTIEDVGRRRVWLLVSRGGARLVALEHFRAGGTVNSSTGVTPLGDLDGDGRAELALHTRRGSMTVLYGRTRWPSRVDLHAAPGADAATVVGTAATGQPSLVARTGRALTIGVSCVARDCSPNVIYRVTAPAPGQVARLAGAERLPAPVPAAGDGRLELGASDVWANGTPPVLSWTVDLPGDEGASAPLLQAGPRTWRLGESELLVGATPGAALVATSSDAPPGEANLWALVLRRLDDDGGTKRRELVKENETFAGGALTTAGRCLLVSGWTATPPMVWAIDARSLDTVKHWAYPGAAMVVAQAAAGGRTVDSVVVRGSGTLARTTTPLPDDCA
ncbi:MAG TPA: VCBS repeat-containing protein [Baekduia sp.]